MREYHFFVCSHGFGHIKRDLGLIREILKFDSDIKIYIYVNLNHYMDFSPYIIEWYPNLNQDKIIFDTNYMNNSPDYLNTSGYSFQLYCEWINELKKIEFNKNSIIFSDNLIGLIAVNKQAILIGSFLWTEIKSMTTKSDYKKIHEYEVSLLRKYKPKMLGINQIVMPGVLNKTNFISFPWLCDKFSNQKEENIKDNKKTILISGGSNKIIKDVENIINLLSKHDLCIYVDNGIYNNLNQKKDVSIFDYKESSYKCIRYIIGRPGIGLLLDSIKYSIPILMIFETENEEMIHNSNIVSKLGFGININSFHIEKSANNELISIITNNKLYKDFKKALNNQLIGGNKLMAKYIISLN